MLPEAYLSPAVFAHDVGIAEPFTVLLGLSGGSDSVTLLDLLLEDGIRVHAVHINHGIRGAEADRDENFCRELCEKRGVPLTVHRIDIPGLASERGEGTEECARNERYRLFEEDMKKLRIHILCTAHNADDNAETLLFNLARGTSAKGGCGIPQVRRLTCGWLFRPMLRLPKTLILERCRERGLEYVTDSTNSDTVYSRNRIRANIIPELKKINPDFIEAVTGFTDCLSSDCSYLDSLAEGFIFKNPEPGLSRLHSLPKPVLSRVLMTLAKEAGARPERIHIETLLEGIEYGKKTAVTMPGGIIAGISPKKTLYFIKDERKKKNTANGEKTDVQNG